MPLTESEQRQLQVLVTPAGWVAHQALPEANRIDAELAYGVYGDLRLVAADMLEAACLAARQVATQVGGGIKRVKLEGELEVERFPQASADAVQADAWCALSARLRSESNGSGVPGPMFTEIT